MITTLFVFISCLAIYAFFSGSEMAYVSASVVKFREKADSGDEKAKKILRLLEMPKEFLTVVLIANNIAGIAATAMFTYWLEKTFGVANEWLVTLVMAPLFIILGETVPKDYGRRRASEYLVHTVWLLDFMVSIFRIPVDWVLKVTYRLLGPLGEAMDRSIFVSEKEFRLLIEESTKTGVIDSHEKQLIDRIMDFERLTVESVMIPISQVEKVDITGSIGQVKEIARRTKAKMILVREELPTLIFGMIYVFDILFEPNDREGFKKYLRSPIFLPRKTTVEKAFLTLQEKRQSFAEIIDENGEVIGVVPIEKLFTA